MSSALFEGLSFYALETILTAALSVLLTLRKKIESSPSFEHNIDDFSAIHIEQKGRMGFNCRQLDLKLRRGDDLRLQSWLEEVEMCVLSQLVSTSWVGRGHLGKESEPNMGLSFHEGPVWAPFCYCLPSACHGQETALATGRLSSLRSLKCWGEHTACALE